MKFLLRRASGFLCQCFSDEHEDWCRALDRPHEMAIQGPKHDTPYGYCFWYVEADCIEELKPLESIVIDWWDRKKEGVDGLITIRDDYIE